jgi:hypothetical protein
MSIPAAPKPNRVPYVKPKDSRRLVQAKKPKDDDPGVMLVYGADGEITDLELVRGDHQEELHKKTQQLRPTVRSIGILRSGWFWKRSEGVLAFASRKNSRVQER